MDPTVSYDERVYVGGRLKNEEARLLYFAQLTLPPNWRSRMARAQLRLLVLLLHHLGQCGDVPLQRVHTPYGTGVQSDWGRGTGVDQSDYRRANTTRHGTTG